MSSDLITTWLAEYGAAPVRPRDALDSQPLRDALITILPELGTNPHPKIFSDWLARNENRPIPNGSGCYRFSRMGHRWRVLPALKVVID